jgi:hypothetical protein
MTMLKIAGTLFLLIGAASGAGLVAAPLVPGAAAGPSSWILFPLGFAAGSSLFALGSDVGSPSWLWRLCGGWLLLLAVAAGTALALATLGALEPLGNTLSLWYVLVVASPVGAACTSVAGQARLSPARSDPALRDAPSSR